MSKNVNSVVCKLSSWINLWLVSYHANRMSIITSNDQATCSSTWGACLPSDWDQRLQLLSSNKTSNDSPPFISEAGHMWGSLAPRLSCPTPVRGLNSVNLTRVLYYSWSGSEAMLVCTALNLLHCSCHGEREGWKIVAMVMTRLPMYITKMHIGSHLGTCCLHNQLNDVYIEIMYNCCQNMIH